MLPNALLQAGEPGYANKKCVIWVSPTDAAEDRVMSLRRNVHIDCDFVASAVGNSLNQLVSLALQDVLLWLGAKVGRQQDTFVYVGRVGSEKLILAWKPGTEVSYAAMLELMAKRTLLEMKGYDPKKDKKSYATAENLIIDYSSRLPPEDEPPESPPESPPPAPPTAPPPASSPASAEASKPPVGGKPQRRGAAQRAQGQASKPPAESRSGPRSAAQRAQGQASRPPAESGSQSGGAAQQSQGQASKKDKTKPQFDTDLPND